MGLAATSGDQKMQAVHRFQGLFLFYAFMATAIVSLREDGKNGVGRHRQKLYQEAFRSYLPKPFQNIMIKFAHLSKIGTQMNWNFLLSVCPEVVQYSLNPHKKEL